MWIIRGKKRRRPSTDAVDVKPKRILKSLSNYMHSWMYNTVEPETADSVERNGLGNFTQNGSWDTILLDPFDGVDYKITDEEHDEKYVAVAVDDTESDLKYMPTWMRQRTGGLKEDLSLGLESSAKGVDTKYFLEDLSFGLASLDLKSTDDEVYANLVNTTLVPPKIRKQARNIFDEIISEFLQEVAAENLEQGFELSREEKKEAERLIYGTDEKEIVIKKFNVDLLGKDMHTLQDGVWLNDEVINFHIKMFQDRMLDYQKSPTVPSAEKVRCLFFNTFFYSKLTQKGKGYKYKGVRRWSKKQKLEVHPSSIDKVIVPVNVHGTHWCLAVINFQKKRFEYFDSLGSKNIRCLENLRQYVIDEMKHYRNEVVDLSDWTNYFPKDIPQQNNGCDCGVFTTQFANYASLNRKFDFSQENMSYFRRKMAIDIARGSIT